MAHPINRHFDVLYRVRPASPEAHLFEVEVIIRGPSPAPLTLSLPAWIPGSYMIRDFARNLLDVRAERAGAPVRLRKLDKQTWQADAGTGPLALRYRVYANDLSVRTAFLDGTRGYFNGPSVFLRAVGVLSLIHISEPTRRACRSRMPSSA